MRLSRSEILRHLLESGLEYETVVLPEQRKRADDAQKISQVFAAFEITWPKFVDVEEFYTSEPGNERQSSAEVAVV
jgi:hypothetical protein